MSSVEPGTYYLAQVDSLERRTYARAMHTWAAAPLAGQGAASRQEYRAVAASVRPMQRGVTLAAPLLRMARRICRA